MSTENKIEDNIVEKSYELFDGQTVTLLLVRLGHTFMLWIGESGDRATLDRLSLAIAANQTPILGLNGDSVSGALASKLSVKYNNSRPVYVAYNYPNCGLKNSDVLIKINERIIEFLNEFLVKS